MEKKEFEERLQKIADDTGKQVAELVLQVRRENTEGGETGRDAVKFEDGGFDEWERTADRFAEICGWIYDRMKGKMWSDTRTMTHKIRKVLGYSYP